MIPAWLALVWVVSRPDHSPVPTGLALAGLLGGGAFLFTWGGGLGLDEALQRGSRAVLLVAVATWLRAAAGAPGLREVSHRALGRLSRLPAMREAARTLDAIGSEGRLAASGRALLDALSDVPRHPLPILDAVLGWVGSEATAFRAGAPARPLALRMRPADVGLVLLAAGPGLILIS